MNPKQLTWSGLKVGIVVLIGLIIFVFVVSVVGTEQNIFTSTYTLKFFVPNIQGLVNGGMITLGGLKIGYVRDLQFVMRDGVNGVEITAQVLSKHRSTITTSSQAQMKTIGLLGDKYIDISIGNAGETALAENSFVPVTPSFDIETAGPQLKQSLNDFTELMSSAKRIAATIDRGEGSVGRLLRQPTVAAEMEHFLRSLNKVMAAVERSDGLLGSMVHGEALSRHVGEVAGNLAEVTGRIKEGKGTAGKLVMDDRLYGNISSFAARADSLLGKANADSSSVSMLIRDSRFYDRLTLLMRDLNALLLDLKEHPERYVKVTVF